MKHLLTLTLCLLPMLGPLRAAEPRPNILLIMADDLGYGDPGCYGGKLVPTPAIDSLARDGVRCNNGYVTAPVCAPSRCGLMTGAYNQRFDMQWNQDQYRHCSYLVPAAHPLLPPALKGAGYVTGHIGKWNVSVDIAGCFDETHDVIDWEADYCPLSAGHYRGVDNPAEPGSRKVQGVWVPERPGEEYLTDRIGCHAVEFVEQHKAQPFFLHLAFNHDPELDRQMDEIIAVIAKGQAPDSYRSPQIQLTDKSRWTNLNHHKSNTSRLGKKSEEVCL
jgi:arylsulfatase A-like enzyme